MSILQCYMTFEYLASSTHTTSLNPYPTNFCCMLTEELQSPAWQLTPPMPHQSLYFRLGGLDLGVALKALHRGTTHHSTFKYPPHYHHASIPAPYPSPLCLYSPSHCAAWNHKTTVPLGHPSLCFHHRKLTLKLFPPHHICTPTSTLATASDLNPVPNFYHHSHMPPFHAPLYQCPTLCLMQLHQCMPQYSWSLYQWALLWSSPMQWSALCMLPI